MRADPSKLEFDSPFRKMVRPRLILPFLSPIYLDSLRLAKNPNPRNATPLGFSGRTGRSRGYLGKTAMARNASRSSASDRLTCSFSLSIGTVNLPENGK